MGIGGIGMSALARYFLQLGKKVAGYDLTPTAITEQLQALGAEIHFNEDISKIPASVDVVVLTPAIPKQHLEYQHFIKTNVPILKRSEVLGMISRSFPNVAVAGTHGKTSTTAMLAHIFHEERQIIAFIGGVAKNFDSNFVLDAAPELMIEEADEFDRSFLTLSPDIQVVTSMDADHLDIYGDRDHLKTSFQMFVQQRKEKGVLILHEKLRDELSAPRTFLYGTSPSSDYYLSDIQLFTRYSEFKIHFQNSLLAAVRLSISGVHNVWNAAAAFAVAHQSGMAAALIAQKLSTFAGVKRRFDYQIDRPDFVFIDDYAHHPEEIRALLTSVRKIYPNRRITGIFQPHLFSRTRDFAPQFAEVLALLDDIILLDIYPARELPIEGVTSQWLLSLIKKKDKKMLPKEALLGYLSAHRPDVLLTIGAGDIDQLVPKIKQIFH